MCFVSYQGVLVENEQESRARLASGFLADRRSSGLVLARTTGGLGKEAATTLGRVRGLASDYKAYYNRLILH